LALAAGPLASSASRITICARVHVALNPVGRPVGMCSYRFSAYVPRQPPPPLSTQQIGIGSRLGLKPSLSFCCCSPAPREVVDPP
jgi:hypothetical protein